MKSKIYIPILIFLVVLVAGVVGGLKIVRMVGLSKPMDERAYRLMMEEKYDLALKELNRAIKINPKDAWAYSARGTVYYRMTNFDKAITDYTAAIALEPKDATNYFQRAFAYQMKSEWEKASADFDKGIQLNPDDPTAYANRGYFYAIRKETDKAMEDFNKALRLNPQDAASCMYRGGIHAAKTNYDDALKDLTAAIKLRPTWSMPYNRRGSVYGSMGRYEESLKDFRDALQFGKRDAESCNNLAWLLATSPDASMRNGEEAVELAKRACELTQWQENHTLDTLASAYAEFGDFEKAVKYQKLALETKDIPPETLKGEKERLAMYEKHQPYRQQPKKTGDD